MCEVLRSKDGGSIYIPIIVFNYFHYMLLMFRSKNSKEVWIAGDCRRSRCRSGDHDSHAICDM